MTKEIWPGALVPDISLEFMTDGVLKAISARKLVGRQRALLLGVPQAYDTTAHAANFVGNAPQLKLAGNRVLACIVPNDAVTVNNWARITDPHGHVLFLADPYFAFSAALGMVRKEGNRKVCDHYLLTAEGGTIKRLRSQAGLSASEPPSRTGDMAFL